MRSISSFFFVSTRAGKTSFVFFPAADSSRAGRVFARGLGFRAASFSSSLRFRHFSSRFFFRRSRRLFPGGIQRGDKNDVEEERLR